MVDHGGDPDVGGMLADTIEGRVQVGTQRADKLTQATLAKAFRGELVPTEAELARQEARDYEPASVLLERIRAEREAQADKPKTRRPRKPKHYPLSATGPMRPGASGLFSVGVVARHYRRQHQSLFRPDRQD